MTSFSLHIPRLAMISAWVCVFTACASTPPSPELLKARTSFQRAQKGPAAEKAPVELDNARIALHHAEKAFSDNPESKTAKALAYIAERKAEIAESQARKAIAEKKTEQIRLQIKRNTQKELLNARRELAYKGKALAATEKELSKERQARKEAERTAAAALKSLREVANVKEESRGLVITLSGSVLFASGRSNLLPIAKRKLDQVAQALKEHSGQQIIVEGHTDSRGSDRTNQALSLLRAQSVRSHLITQGVKPAEISAIGLGETRPVASNRTADGRANNRRVEIVIKPPRDAN